MYQLISTQHALPYYIKHTMAAVRVGYGKVIDNDVIGGVRMVDSDAVCLDAVRGGNLETWSNVVFGHEGKAKNKNIMRVASVGSSHRSLQTQVLFQCSAMKNEPLAPQANTCAPPPTWPANAHERIFFFFNLIVWHPYQAKRQ